MICVKQINGQFLRSLNFVISSQEALTLFICLYFLQSHSHRYAYITVFMMMNILQFPIYHSRRSFTNFALPRLGLLPFLHFKRFNQYLCNYHYLILCCNLCFRSSREGPAGWRKPMTCWRTPSEQSLERTSWRWTPPSSPGLGSRRTFQGEMPGSAKHIGEELLMMVKH